MKSAVAAILLLLELVDLSAAQTNALSFEMQRLKQATAKSMDWLSKGQTSEAFADLFKGYWPKKAEASAEASSLAADFRRGTNLLESELGKQLAGQYEFLGTRRLGMSYLTLVYVQKHEYGALPAAFLFYRGQDGWFLNNTSLGNSAKPDLISLAQAGTGWQGLEPLKQATDDCMTGLSQGRMSEAFTGLFKRYSPGKDQANTNAESLTASFQSGARQVESAIGKRLSGQYESLGVTRSGHNYASLVYIQKHERGALMIAFTFYHGVAGWFVVKTIGMEADKVDARLWVTEAETLSPEADALKHATDRCMSLLSTGQLGEAFTNLYQGYWPDKEEANSKAEALTMRVKHLGSQYRFSVGNRLPGQYEFIGARRLGSAYVTLFYIQKHEFGVSPVSFQFYKGAQNWILSESVWGDEAEPDRALWTEGSKRQPSDLGPVKQMADTCMTSLSRGDIRPALTNFIQRYWAFEEEALAKGEALSLDVQRGITQSERSIGKPLPGQYELGGSRCLGSGYAVMVYILKHEYGGFTIRLAFWKGKTRWYLRAINFDNDPQPAIDHFSIAERAN